MKYLWILFTALIIGFSTSGTTLADNAQDIESMKAQAMAKWQEYATPGDGHKVLEQLAGNWNYSIKYWTLPDAPPSESEGTNDIKWILGNRFLEMNVKGTSNDQPFEGIGFIGYDNAKKQYVNMWIDTMGTGMMSATGTYDAETKTMTEKGTFTDPAAGELSFRGVTKFIDENHMTYEMYISTPDGGEFRNMEINYTRKK